MIGGWKYAAASVIGTSHLTSPGGVCQDSYRCGYLAAQEVFVAVVSDGAGSARYAEQGSQLVCDFVIRHVGSVSRKELHTPSLAKSAVGLIQQCLLQAASGLGARMKDFACTLLVAIVEDDRATFWQIGDGAICFRLRADEAFHYAFWPVKGEYANITQFITDPNALEELEFDTGEMRVADLAVFSDGLERLALDFKSFEVHRPFLQPLFPYLYRRRPGHLDDISMQMANFLSSERVNGHTDDDKTLVLATLEDDAP